MKAHKILNILMFDVEARCLRIEWKHFKQLLSQLYSIYLVSIHIKLYLVVFAGSFSELGTYCTTIGVYLLTSSCEALQAY